MALICAVKRPHLPFVTLKVMTYFGKGLDAFL